MRADHLLAVAQSLVESQGPAGEVFILHKDGTRLDPGFWQCHKLAEDGTTVVRDGVQIVPEVKK